MAKRLRSPMNWLLASLICVLVAGGLALVPGSVQAASPDYVPGGGEVDPEPPDPGPAASEPFPGGACTADEYQQEVWWRESCLVCTDWKGDHGFTDYLLRCYLRSDGTYQWGYAPGSYTYCNTSRTC